MKKLLILIAFLFCAVVSFAQFPNSQSVSNASTLYHIKGGVIGDVSVLIPNVDTLNNIATPYQGALTVRPQDGLLWMSDGVNWHRFVSSSGAGVFLDTIYTQLPIFVRVDSSFSPPHRIITLLHANGLLSGGVVTQGTNCFTLDVTASVIILQYKQYSAAQDTGIVIAAADPTFGRIDRVVTDSNLNVIVITGTPSATPVPPPYNTFSQVELTQITIPAGATCLSVTQDIIFDGVGDYAGQWTPTTAGTIATNFVNTDNPYHLAQAAFIVTYTDGSQLIFTKPSGTDTVKASSVFKGVIYLLGGQFTNQISAQWYNGTTAASNSILLNPYFNTNNSNLYQIFAPPLSAWSWPGGSEYNKLVLTFGGNDVSGAKGLYLDYLQIQTGINNVATTLQLTTNGSSGAATLIDNVLNIPVYSGQGGGGSVTDTTFEWSVRDSLSTPAVLPNEGSIYLVGTSPTGQFVGHANNIATRDSLAGTYSFDTASVGDLLYNATTAFVSQLIGSTWVRIGRAVIHQGGDKYATNIVIGARDNFGLDLKANDTARIQIANTGASTFTNGISGGNYIKIDPTITGLPPNIEFRYAGSSIVRLNAVVNTALASSAPFEVTGGVKSIGLASGTTVPASTVPVGGSLVLMPTNGSAFVNFANIGNFFSGALGTINTTGDLIYYKNPSNQLAFNGTEVFRAVRSTGNFLIGTPTDVPISKFTVFDTLRGSIPAPKMTAAQRIALGNAILTGAISAGGSGYTNGTYNAVALTGGSGTNATANITVAGGTVISVTMVNRGINYIAGNILSSASIGPGSGFTFPISAVTGAKTPGLLVWDTDSLCLFQYNGTTWDNLCSSGGGGNTIYTADDAIVSDRTVDLNGKFLQFQEGGNSLLVIDPTINNESSVLQARNITGGGNIGAVSAHTTGTIVTFSLESYFNGGTKFATLIGVADATTSSITHTADTHTFNGKIINANDSINTQYNIATWDGDTLKRAALPTSTMQQTFYNSVAVAPTYIIDVGTSTFSIQQNSGGANAVEIGTGGTSTGVPLVVFSGSAADAMQVQSVSGNGINVSTSGVALEASSSGSIVADLTRQDVTTNTVLPVLSIVRIVSAGGNGANGIGSEIQFSAVDVTGAGLNTNNIISKWTDATGLTSEFSIEGVNSTATQTLLTLSGNGEVIINNGALRLKGYTVATLPVGVQGDVVFVTDALAPAYHVTVVGGGAVIVPVFYNGTNWIVN